MAHENLDTGADPGFPIGGANPTGENRHPIRVFFGENVCENERLDSYLRDDGSCLKGPHFRKMGLVWSSFGNFISVTA